MHYPEQTIFARLDNLCAFRQQTSTSARVQKSSVTGYTMASVIWKTSQTQINL